LTTSKSIPLASTAVLIAGITIASAPRQEHAARADCRAVSSQSSHSAARMRGRGYFSVMKVFTDGLFISLVAKATYSKGRPFSGGN
jgi:hypothetical protein